MGNKADSDEAPHSLSLVGMFQRYRKVLAKTVARIVKPHDIEDIVQETYVRIYQASKKGEIQHPKSFMLTTARNLAINHVAKADAMNYLAPVPSEPAAELQDYMLETLNGMAESPEIIVQGEEEFLIFCRAVRELPLQCRRAFILKKVYGISQKEIATRLNLSESTVEKHIAKGIVSCSIYMKSHGYARDEGSKRNLPVARKGKSL